VDSTDLDGLIVAPGVDSPGKRAPRRDAIENRHRLIQAASEVFGEHGTDVSLELVAAPAGLGMATLYRRFPTKNDIVAELTHQLLNYLVDVAAEEATTDDGLGLERWLTEYADLQSRKRGMLGHLWATDPTTAPLRDKFTELLGSLLRQAQEAGHIRPDATLDDVLLLIYALRGIAASTVYDDTGAWRRHLAITLAGLRITDIPLDAPAWSPHQTES
jgi:AcrR family transcriptional regulator